MNLYIHMYVDNMIEEQRGKESGRQTGQIITAWCYMKGVP